MTFGAPTPSTMLPVSSIPVGNFELMVQSPAPQFPYPFSGVTVPVFQG